MLKYLDYIRCWLILHMQKVHSNKTARVHTQETHLPI